MVITDLAFIAAEFVKKEEENFQFRLFLQQQNATTLDAIVHTLNEKIAPKIDCTSCGNCCRHLMINLEDSDINRLASHLSLSTEDFENRYVEKSAGANICIMNTIPCHFLQDNKCTVYTARPEECRTFPGLHQNNFMSRSFASFMHYGKCPIIYNVIEALKQETSFFN